MTTEQVVFRIFELVALAIIPVSFFATVFTWVLAKRYWKYGARLPVVLAVVNTIAFVISAILGIVAYRALVNLPRLAQTGVIATVCIFVLMVIPLLTSGYLAYLEVKARRGEPTPPILGDTNHDPEA